MSLATMTMHGNTRQDDNSPPTFNEAHEVAGQPGTTPSKEFEHVRIRLKLFHVVPLQNTTVAFAVSYTNEPNNHEYSQRHVTSQSQKREVKNNEEHSARTIHGITSQHTSQITSQHTSQIA
jgi:hypothetical protein